MAGIPRGQLSNTAPQGQAEGRSGKGFGLVGMTGDSSPLGDWEPTVVYLLVLVIIEFAAYCGLRYAFRNVHGG